MYVVVCLSVGLSQRGPFSTSYRPTHFPLTPHTTQASFGGAASLISTTLAHSIGGYGAALWLSVLAVFSCTALFIGYHPTRGLVPSAAARANRSNQEKEKGVGVGGERVVEMVA